MTKLVAFDLDGTLNMTHTYAVAAYQEALKELGAGPVAESVIRSYRTATNPSTAHNTEYCRQMYPSKFHFLFE